MDKKQPEDANEAAYPLYRAQAICRGLYSYAGERLDELEQGTERLDIQHMARAIDEVIEDVLKEIDELEARRPQRAQAAEA